MFDGGGSDSRPQPLYAIAEAKRKQGKYAEAVKEIQTQLDRFPHDYQGWLMLADIQAENLHDLPAAVQTIQQTVNLPDQPANRVAFALNRVVDWQLKLARDYEAARQTLEAIVDRFPNSSEAHAAQQRLAHFGNFEQYAAAHNHVPLALPHSDEHLGLREDFTGLKPPPEDHVADATKLLRHLDEFPLDNEAREKLALIYAEHFHRLDLASDQFEQLLAQPGVSTREITRWLNLLADVQVKYGDDLATARQTLERIIQQFSHSAAAENAQRRLNVLKLEAPLAEREAMKLGTYEQNLGLKMKRPPH